MADPITPGLATAFDNTGPTAITPSGAAAFDNTAPATITPAGAAAFSNDTPGTITPGLAGAASNDAPATITPAGATAFSNTEPTPINSDFVDGFDDSEADPITPLLASSMSNTPPTAIVLDGETFPGSVIGSIDVLTVNYETTLNNSQSYRVMVTSRAAAVTVTLPDPGASGQTVEVVDASQQADDYPITVDAGTKTIIGHGSEMVISNPGAIVRFTYTGSNWI